MFEASEVREVDNSKTLFVIISSNSSAYGLKDSKNTRFTDGEIEKNAGIFQEKVGARLQSIEDEAIERENLLAERAIAAWINVEHGNMVCIQVLKRTENIMEK